MTDASQPPDEPPSDEFAFVKKWWARLANPGCFVRVGGAIIVLVVFFVLLIEFGPSSSNPPEEFVAGPADEFALADVNAFDAENIFLVRYPDGSFRAFSNKSSKQQELGGDCRMRFDETGLPGTLEQVPGMVGVFEEECDGNRAAWRVDGAFAFGANYGDLDEFKTRIDDAGNIVVITETRTCTRSVGVIGIEPFEVQECDGAP